MSSSKHAEDPETLADLKVVSESLQGIHALDTRTSTGSSSNVTTPISFESSQSRSGFRGVSLDNSLADRRGRSLVTRMASFPSESTDSDRTLHPSSPSAQPIVLPNFPGSSSDVSVRNSPVASPMTPGSTRLTHFLNMSFCEEDELAPLSGDDSTYSPFRKLMDSDLSDAEILHMLSACRESCELLSTFTDDDLQRLAPVLTVMRFQDKDVVITKGERASFAAIVLEGSCLVKVDDKLFFDCLTGETIGEMAYFEGGTRSADVLANGPAVLGLLLFEDLEALKHYEPDLFSRVLHTLTIASIRRLRHTITALEGHRQAARQRIGEVETVLRGVARGECTVAAEGEDLYRVQLGEGGRPSGARAYIECGDVGTAHNFRDEKLKQQREQRDREQRAYLQRKRELARDGAASGQPTSESAEGAVASNAPKQATSDPDADTSTPPFPPVPVSAPTGEEAAQSPDQAVEATAAAEHADAHPSESLFQRRMATQPARAAPRASEMVVTGNNAAVALALGEGIRALLEQHKNLSLPNMSTARKVITGLQSHLLDVRRRLTGIGKTDAELRACLSRVREEARRERGDKVRLEQRMRELRVEMAQREDSWTAERDSLVGHVAELEEQVSVGQGVNTALTRENEELTSALLQLRQENDELRESSKIVFDRMYLKMIKYSGSCLRAEKEVARLRSESAVAARTSAEVLQQFGSLAAQRAEEDRRLAQLQTLNDGLRLRLTKVLHLWALQKQQAGALRRVLMRASATSFVKLRLARGRVLRLCQQVFTCGDDVWDSLSSHVHAGDVYLQVGDEPLLRSEDDAQAMRAARVKYLAQLKGQSLLAQLSALADGCNRLEQLRSTQATLLETAVTRTQGRMDAALKDHERLRGVDVENIQLRARVRKLDRELNDITTAGAQAAVALECRVSMCREEVAQLERTQRLLSKQVKTLAEEKETMNARIRRYSRQARVFVGQCAWTVQQHALRVERAEVAVKLAECRQAGDREGAERWEGVLAAMPVPDVSLPMTAPQPPELRESEADDVSENPSTPSQHVEPIPTSEAEAANESAASCALSRRASGRLGTSLSSPAFRNNRSSGKEATTALPLPVVPVTRPVPVVTDADSIGVLPPLARPTQPFAAVRVVEVRSAARQEGVRAALTATSESRQSSSATAHMASTPGDTMWMFPVNPATRTPARTQTAAHTSPIKRDARITRSTVRTPARDKHEYNFSFNVSRSPYRAPTRRAPPSIE